MVNFMNLTETMINIIKKYKIQTFGIFGSRARGDFREDSDYDIFIISDGLSIKDEFEIESILEKELNKNIDLIKLNKRTDKILLKNILNDAVVLYNENNEYEKLYNYIDNFFIENHDFIKLRERELLD